MNIVLWFTGLSGSGKTTIALELLKRLQAMNKKVAILDGDVVRNTLHKHLGFSREDIRENNRLIAKLACEKISEVDVVFVPIISPYIEDRAMARSMIGEKFVELYINCPLEDCIRRDPKGNYKKAISGKIDNFIGIADSNPYEPPLNPELEIKTNEYNLEHCVAVIVDYLNKSEI